jgi:hypothetical protein
MAIDTPRVAKRLCEAGFTEPQAEAVTAPVQEATQGAEPATKADVAALRSELRQSELRLEAKVEALRSDIRGCEGRHRGCEGRHPEPYLRHDPRYAGRKHHRCRRSDVRGGETSRTFRTGRGPAEPAERQTTPAGSCRILFESAPSQFVVIRLFGRFKFVDPLKNLVDPRRNEFAI